jgi:regulator of sigma E protease
MAINFGKDKETLFASTDLMSFGKAFSRMAAQPLDMYEVWYDLTALENYAASGETAYVGQKVVYIDADNKVTHYSIEADGSLKELGTTPIGDNKSVVVDENGTISLKGVSALAFEREVDGETVEVKFQPLMTKDGLVWVEPSKTTVEGLAVLIEELTGRVSALETKVGKAGLLPNDDIIKIDDTNINCINDILVFFNSFTEAKKVTFYVNRTLEDGSVEAKSFEVETYSFAMLDTQNIPQTKTVIGVSTGSSRNFLKSLYMPWVQTGEASIQIFKTLGLFFQKDSGVKLTDLSGPVGILNLFTQLVQGDDVFYNILYWTGLLSVNIGLINLFPLPALDGGRLAFLGYEGITRKKATPKVENTIHNIGFILLMGLFVVVLISDIVKCF